MVDKYEALTEQFIRDMEAVGGSFEAFVEGLKFAASEVRDRWNGAQNELRAMRKNDGREDEG